MSTDVWFLNVHQMAPLHFGINRLSGHWLLVTPQHQWPSEDSDQWGHIRRLPRKKKRNCFNISALLANRKQLDRCLPMCLILAASASVAQQVAYWMLLLALHSPHCTWSFCQKKKKAASHFTNLQPVIKLGNAVSRHLHVGSVTTLRTEQRRPQCCSNAVNCSLFH